MIETYLWKQLVALAKYGTLSEVANRLNLSQSALSRSMQKLEQHIGVELFVRKKKIPLLLMTTEFLPFLTNTTSQQRTAFFWKS